MWIVLSINNSKYQYWQVSVLIWSIELSISYVSLRSDNISYVEMSYVLALLLHCHTIVRQSKLYTPSTLKIKCPVPSTNQALPSCFYFRILWILMEKRCSYFLSPRHLYPFCNFENILEKHFLICEKSSLIKFDPKKSKTK